MKVPKWSTLWELYPKGDKSIVANQVGGRVLSDFNDDPEHYNTCCIRTSLALNYSGAKIDKHFCDGLKNPYVPPKVRAYLGKDKLWYIASVYDMRVYLTARFEHPQRIKKMSAEDLAKKSIGGGILMFFSPHCDIWNGSDIRYNHDEWTNPKVEELLFWPSTPEDGSTPT